MIKSINKWASQFEATIESDSESVNHLVKFINECSWEDKLSNAIYNNPPIWINIYISIYDITTIMFFHKSYYINTFSTFVYYP